MNRCVIQHQKQGPADYLNPRRRMIAEQMIAYFKWHGCKVILDSDNYWRISDELKLDRYMVDGAIDDLYALGLVAITGSGRVYSVRLLTDDLDQAPNTPKPRFASVGGRI
ncbi:MAG TPA: hypothetical protein VIM11_18670 [Tepidisphaeraceae bacterium]